MSHIIFLLAESTSTEGTEVDFPSVNLGRCYVTLTWSLRCALFLKALSSHQWNDCNLLYFELVLHLCTCNVFVLVLHGSYAILSANQHLVTLIIANNIAESV